MLPLIPPVLQLLPCAGQQYPAKLAHTQRLRQALQPGRLRGAITVGGCLVQPLPRSRGRYLLCIAQRDQGAAEAVIKTPTASTGEDQES